MSIKIIRLPNQKIEKQRAKTSGKIEKQGMVRLIENELTTKDGLEFALRARHKLQICASKENGN